MKNVKRMMVGVDIYAKANNVLKRAFMVAHENKAELFIIYAIPTPWFDVPSYFSSKEITIDTDNIKKKIDKKVKVLNSKYNVPYTVLMKEGSAHDVLAYEAKLLKADMVVIGANTSGKKHYLGSTAEKVAHESHLPVLIVKNPVKGTYKNIVAATDFLIQSKHSILFAKVIFPTAKINAVHSVETTMYIDGPYTMVGRDLSEFNRVARLYAGKEMNKMVKDMSLDKGKVFDGEFNTKRALVKYIDKGKYDLTVVGSRGTAGFKALLGSMASSILRETPTDVLVYVP